MKHSTPVSMLLAGLLLMGVLVMGVHSLAGAGTNAGAASSARMLLTGLLVMGVFGSCSKDPLEQDTGTGIQAGGTVRTMFDLGQEFEQAITVKAADAVDVNLIKNVWVLQFDESGQEVQKPQLIRTVDTVDGDYRIEVGLTAVRSQVWFLANADAVTVNPTTLAEMQNMYRTFSTESNFLQYGTVPMQGVWEGTPGGSAGVPDRVSLKRSVCRVTLDLSAQLPAGDVFLLNNIHVRQIPIALYFARKDERAAQYPYPNLYSFTQKTVDWSRYVGITYDGSTSAVQEFSWLLPENARGFGTAAEPIRKTGDTAPAGQGQLVTYIELEGVYTRAGKKGAAAKYRIYLGANNTDDYNLLRGHTYTVRTVIRGASTADSRLEYVEPLDYTDNGRQYFRVMARPYYGEFQTLPYSLLHGETECPKGWRVPTRGELMIAYAYYKALPDAGFSGTYATTSHMGAGTFYRVNLDPRGGLVAAETYNADTEYQYRCVQDVADIIGKRKYPCFATSADNNMIIISRDADGGVHPEALGAGGRDDLVSPKFEIQRAVSYTAVPYSTAAVSCPEGWRLPNQREGMLMAGLAANGICNFQGKSPDGDYYWLYPGTYRICMSTVYDKLPLGHMYSDGADAYVRCIRDIVD